MERKGTIKLEDWIDPSSFSADPAMESNPFTDMFNFGSEVNHKSSLGFIELLGIQDFSSSFLDSILQLPTVAPTEEPPSALTPTSTVPGSSEVVNTPATPNSSYVSSGSSGADLGKVVDDEEVVLQKTKKQLKPKKTCQKKQREPRFAFMTKSEVDHLEDGYRWRKYGQKAVKNSPFPRSYYRCTTSTCNVKKRVERSFSDPGIVVTTYEGQHTHPSPLMPRGSPIGFSNGPGMSTATAAAFALPYQMTFPHQPQFISNLGPMNCGRLSSTNLLNASVQERSFGAPTTAFLRDNGLLQDIVPSIAKKEE